MSKPYPQDIRADSGTECIRCSGKKARGARFCHNCSPAFSSRSAGEAWCRLNSIGSCVFFFTEWNRSGLIGLVYNHGSFYRTGEWPEEPGRVWG